MSFVKKIKTQSLIINYRSRSLRKIKKYYPDIQLLLIDGRLAIIEVKPFKEMVNYRNIKKHEALEKYCKKNRYGYAILDYDGDVKVFGYTDSAPFEYADTYYLEKSGYRFTIKLYNNFQIVKINQDRKINGLQFYPFDKNMDNYGTLYVSIYCQKIKETDIKNTTISDGILKHIIDSTEDIKFVSMDIKQPLYYSIGGTNNVSN